MEIITGGVTAAKGFMAAGVEAGIKYQNRKDMAMVYSKTPCRAAGVVYDECSKSRLLFYGINQVVEKGDTVKAIAINSGIANACTGKLGEEANEKFANIVGNALNVKKRKSFRFDSIRT